MILVKKSTKHVKQSGFKLNVEIIIYFKSYLLQIVSLLYVLY